MTTKEAPPGPMAAARKGAARDAYEHCLEIIAEERLKIRGGPPVRAGVEAFDAVEERIRRMLELER